MTLDNGKSQRKQGAAETGGWHKDLRGSLPRPRRRTPNSDELATITLRGEPQQWGELKYCLLTTSIE
jgi:hypothetical protein